MQDVSATVHGSISPAAIFYARDLGADVSSSYDNILQHTATHCNTLHHTATHSADVSSTHAATDTNAYSPRAPIMPTLGEFMCKVYSPRDTHVHQTEHATENMGEYASLQHTATHPNTLQHTPTHLLMNSWAKSTHPGICPYTEHTEQSMPQRTCESTPRCNTLQHTATHRSTPQRTATHCNAENTHTTNQSAS